MARLCSWLTHTDTLCTWSPKKPPATIAIIMKRYSREGRSISETSVPNMNGRKYRLCVGSSDSMPSSAATTRSMASTKVSSGSSGMHSRRVERWKRRAWSRGRNTPIDPSALRWALRPSNATCP